MDLVYGDMSGKQAAFIHIADAKPGSFSVHSPHDIQSCSDITTDLCSSSQEEVLFELCSPS